LLSADEELVQDLDPPEFHLAVLNKQIREMMDITLRPYDLRLVEWRILECLRTGRSLTICDLAELAVIERTVTGRLVERLSNRGLMKRKAMARDRRYAQVTLTARGARLVSAADEAVARSRQRLFAGMSEGEIAGLLSTLKRLQNNAVDAYHKTGL